MRLFLLLNWMILLVACSQDDNSTDYDTISYQSDISGDLAFEFLNDAFEPAPLFESIDSTQRASTDAKLVVINDSLNLFFVVNQMRCRSWMEHDTLWIQISRSDGFIAHGLNVKIRDGKFKCFPFYSTDVIFTGEKEPVVVIEKQKVTLDKEIFQIGDSLHGEFYMRAMIDGKEKKYASGYFRTKIMKGL